jgi:hypothetical protein
VYPCQCALLAEGSRTQRATDLTRARAVMVEVLAALPTALAFGLGQGPSREKVAE